MTLGQNRRGGFLSDVVPDDFPLVTVILIGVCALFYFITVKFTADASGQEVIEPSGKALITYGAMVPVLVAQGEWWRFFSSIVLHGGVMHIIMNGLGLWVLGREVESRFGRARTVTVFVVTGAAGMALAYQVNPMALVVGASGAIFGFMGLMIGHALRHRTRRSSAELRSWLIPMLLYGVIFSFLPGISFAAHLGGLVSGAAFGVFIGDKQVVRRVPIVWSVAAFAALAWVAAALVLATRSPFLAYLPS